MKTLSELIAEVGDANVELQFLSESLTGTHKQCKGHIEITFGTNAVSLIDLISDKPQKVGLVVWLPGDQFRAIAKRQSVSKPVGESSIQLTGSPAHPLTTQDL